MSYRNFSTYWLCHSGIFSFRLLGFGIFAHHMHFAPITKSSDAALWWVPITPNWRFAFIGPWH